MAPYLAISCNPYKYLEYFDGAVSGNKNCGDNPELIPGTKPNCPVFADAGCFTGTNAQYVSTIFSNIQFNPVQSSSISVTNIFLSFKKRFTRAVHRSPTHLQNVMLYLVSMFQVKTNQDSWSRNHEHL